MQSNTLPPRRVQALGIVFLLLGGLACIVFLAAKHRTSARIDSLEAQVDALSHQVEDLRTRVELMRRASANGDLEAESADLRVQLLDTAEVIVNARRDDQAAFSVQNLAFLLYVGFTLLGACLVVFGSWQAQSRSSF